MSLIKNNKIFYKIFNKIKLISIKIRKIVIRTIKNKIF
jgi:hypothetical protein